MRKSIFVLILIFIVSGFLGNDVYAGTSSSKGSSSTSKSSSAAGSGFKSGSFSTTKPSGSTSSKTPTPTAPTKPTSPTPTTPSKSTTDAQKSSDSSTSKPVENKTYNTYNYHDYGNSRSSSDGFWSGMFWGSMLSRDSDRHEHRTYTEPSPTVSNSGVGKFFSFLFTAIAVIGVIAIIVYKVREYIKRRRRL